MTYKFDSEFALGKNFDQKFNQTEVKNEPMFFSSSGEFAMENGGPITKSFIRAFMKERPLTGNFIFDSRVHMLMPGWYPCIPGYHHDDVPRSTVNGQPNYDEPEYHAQHCMGLINGDICPTVFAVGSAVFELPNEGPIYKKWHSDVEKYIKKKVLREVKAPSGKLIHFNSRSFHQGTAAIANGWRWFGRISWETKRPVTNEIRRQVQVYMSNLTEGW